MTPHTIRIARMLQQRLAAVAAILVTTVAITTTATAQVPLAADSVLTARVREHVRYLSSDELAGRRTSEPGNEAAAAYIAARFKEFGLEPVPGGEGYLHRFDYLASVTAGPNNSLVVSTGHFVHSLMPGDHYNPLGFSDDGNVGGRLVFVGYGITSTEDKYDDYAGIDVKGKIVVAMRYSPDASNPHGALTRYSSFASKVRIAHEHGAAGIIFINQPTEPATLLPLQLDRSFTRSGLPAVYMESTLFSEVRDSSRRSLADLQRLIDTTRRPASFEMKRLEASISVDLVFHRANPANVVAMLPGTDPALRDEYIVIGGHFDHLGMGGEGSLDGGHEAAVHHGADDNASGAAGVVELARYYASTHANHRTLVFMTFNGEEEGLLGSAAFMAHSPIPAEKMVAMINMDMIGRLDTSVIIQGMGTSPAWPQLVNEQNHDRFKLKLVDDGFGPSDHSSFYSKGIPVLFFFTGLHSDYHRPTDTWEKINYPGEAKVLSYVADVVNVIDARAERPAFTKTQSSARNSGGFRVYVGSIPDYGYEGKGLRLSGVSEGGPAQKAGLKEGDVIVRFGTKTINNIYDYTDALGAYKPKDKVEIEFLRGDARTLTTVELGSR